MQYAKLEGVTLGCPSMTHMKNRRKHNPLGFDLGGLVGGVSTGIMQPVLIITGVIVAGWIATTYIRKS